MFNKAIISDFFGLSDDDYENTVPEENYYTEAPKRSNSFRQEQPKQSQQPEQDQPSKVVSMRSAQNKFNNKRENRGEAQPKKVVLLEPRTYSESQNIAKCLFRNEIVIINFRLVEERQARRIIDFLTGVVYALDGDVQRIGDEIFLCTPPNTEINGDSATSLLGEQFAEM